MIVTFHIEYRTSWGEEVRILGSVPELGKNNPEQAVALTTVDGIHWSNEISIQLPAEGVVEYSYHIYRDGKGHPYRMELLSATHLSAGRR